MAKKKTPKTDAAAQDAEAPADPAVADTGSGRETIQIGAFTQTHMIVIDRRAPEAPERAKEKANIQRVWTLMNPKRKGGGGPAPGIGSISPSRKT